MSVCIVYVRVCALTRTPALTVCGNQHCELGEGCSPSDLGATIHPSGAVGVPDTGSGCCLLDCPVVVRSCPADAVTGVACSGHGSCLTGVGWCRCFDGYSGDTCSGCSARYMARVDGNGSVSSCMFLPGAVSTCNNGVWDGLEVEVDCGGVCPPCNGTHNSGQATSTTPSTLFDNTSTVYVIGGLPVVAVLLVVVVAAVVYRKRRLGRRRPCESPSTVWQRSARVATMAGGSTGRRQVAVDGGFGAVVPPCPSSTAAAQSPQFESLKVAPWRARFAPSSPAATVRVVKVQPAGSARKSATSHQ